MYRKNTASQFICVQLLLTATGAVATGLSPAARRCIDGTFAAGGGTYTEDGSTGSYKYAMAQADTNGNDISIITTATGAIPVCVNFVTTAADPTDGVRLGLTALPNAAANAAGGLPVSSAGGLDLDEMNVDIEAIQTSTAILPGSFPTNFSSLSITAAGLVSVTSNLKKNTAGRITVTMTDSTNHNPVTGKTVTAQVFIDGAAIATMTNSPMTELSNGDYTIATSAADTNGNAIMFRFSATGCDDVNLFALTQP